MSFCLLISDGYLDHDCTVHIIRRKKYSSGTDSRIEYVVKMNHWRENTYRLVDPSSTDQPGTKRGSRVSQAAARIMKCVATATSAKLKPTVQVDAPYRSYHRLGGSGGGGFLKLLADSS